LDGAYYYMLLHLAYLLLKKLQSVLNFGQNIYWKSFVSDIAIFVLKRDVKLQPTNLLEIIPADLLDTLYHHHHDNLFPGPPG